MRLIDEETLMNDIQNTITEKSSTIDWLNMIYRQPTAYDVEKVVEQLEKLEDIFKAGSYNIATGLNKTIDIVKKGGGVNVN
ncbi:MAG: hypothetical protein MR992_00295 [Lachnospiraceae bacterium]|nr:hypothetical protein [Lachnospiraceae bacterium]MDD7627823.1 hypothetical protein [Lachnospiraceae bacterium]MDY4118781.1 hypothetical protein [Lachnospiraceae bacterium]